MVTTAGIQSFHDALASVGVRVWLQVQFVLLLRSWQSLLLRVVLAAGAVPNGWPTFVPQAFTVAGLAVLSPGEPVRYLEQQYGD